MMTTCRIRWMPSADDSRPRVALSGAAIVTAANTSIATTLRHMNLQCAIVPFPKKHSPAAVRKQTIHALRCGKAVRDPNGAISTVHKWEPLGALCLGSFATLPRPNAAVPPVEAPSIRPLHSAGCRKHLTHRVTQRQHFCRRDDPARSRYQGTATQHRDEPLAIYRAALASCSDICRQFFHCRVILGLASPRVLVDPAFQSNLALDQSAFHAVRRNHTILHRTAGCVRRQPYCDCRLRTERHGSRPFTPSDLVVCDARTSIGEPAARNTRNSERSLAPHDHAFDLRDCDCNFFF